MSNSNLTPKELMQESLMNGVDIGVMICNQDDVIEWMNPYLCNLLGVSEQASMGTQVQTLMDIDPLQTSDNNFRIRVKNDQNEELWLTCIQDTSSDNDKSVRYFIDISDLQRRQPLRLAVSAGLESSRIDPASGVLNRKSIIQELNTQISRSRRYGNPLSAILLQRSFPYDARRDMEKESLQAVAGCINSNLRWVDILGALSPDEFLIVLPESNADGAAQAWRKLSDAILDLTLTNGEADHDYRACYDDWQQDSNADEMIQRLQTSFNQRVA